MDLKKIDNILLVIGKTEGHIDQSIFARDILNQKKGPPPEISLFNEKNNGETVINLIQKNYVKSAHDIALGGIIIAIAKMCIKGNKGVKLKKPNFLINRFEYFFSEDQGRYIVEIEKENYNNVKDILNKNSVHFDELGEIIEKEMIIDEKTKITINELKESYDLWLRKYMSN